MNYISFPPDCTAILSAYTVTAMPILIGVLCCMAIAYRYYSCFLAAKVAALDDSRQTPAERFNDGQNYHPTNKWVLFGHHFAAISGAGPLIGPVLAAQFGYAPGLLWIVIGVCLGGAVQDFLVMAASLRRNGKSLAEIAREDLGRVAGTAATLAILCIIIIALAGLGKVVVMALGGEEVAYPAASILTLPTADVPTRSAQGIYTIPAGTTLKLDADRSMTFTDPFPLKTPTPFAWCYLMQPSPQDAQALSPNRAFGIIPAGATRVVPGSSWGTFTIAATIPIALFIGLYMYKIRPGKVLEASLIGAALTIGATFAGAWVSQNAIGRAFNLTALQVTCAMAVYGFIASVLPVWILLVPRDYLSSFLKIGTIALLVAGVLIANPVLHAPAFNATFRDGGPVVNTKIPNVPGTIFPFLFITIMCGAISGFHSLVSSGTTSKMVRRESDARMIGYGAMLIEGLVGVVAIIAATALPVRDYYAMNVRLADVPAYNDRILAVAGAGGIEHVGDYERLTQESLRGRTGGAVTLAVGMAYIFDEGAHRIVPSAGKALDVLWKYWYHFAIMFEALFILTTIDAGTRIGRFLLQEAAGKLHPFLGRTNWWPGAIVSTLIIVCAWGMFMNSGSFSAIWAMFGIANQMLAVIALAVLSAWLVNEGRARYLWVTVLPMLFVLSTTSTAAGRMLAGLIDGIHTQLARPPGNERTTNLWTTSLQASAILAMLTCTGIIVLASVARAYVVLIRQEPPGGFQVVAAR